MKRVRIPQQLLGQYFEAMLNLVGGKYADLDQKAQLALEDYRYFYYQRGMRGIPFFLIVDLRELFLQGRAFEFRNVFTLSGENELDFLNWSELFIAYKTNILKTFLSYSVFQKIVFLAQENPKRLRKILEIILSSLGKIFDFEDIENEGLKKICFSCISPANSWEFFFHHFPSSVWNEALRNWIHSFQIYEILQKLTPEYLFQIKHYYFFRSPSSSKIFNDFRNIYQTLTPIFHKNSKGGTLLATFSKSSSLLFKIPVGGFHQISSHGRIEDILPFEFLYSDPFASLDLFDIRYSQGETLHYQRRAYSLPRSFRKLAFLFPQYENYRHILLRLPGKGGYKFSVFWLVFSLFLLDNLALSLQFRHQIPIIGFGFQVKEPSLEMQMFPLILKEKFPSWNFYFYQLGKEKVCSSYHQVSFHLGVSSPKQEQSSSVLSFCLDSFAYCSLTLEKIWQLLEFQKEFFKIFAK